ncbi:hypothetical protein PENTCL1PPCAC_7629, partial [Pristionchus entomophagus]
MRMIVLKYSSSDPTRVIAYGLIQTLQLTLCQLYERINSLQSFKDNIEPAAPVSVDTVENGAQTDEVTLIGAEEFNWKIEDTLNNFEITPFEVIHKREIVNDALSNSDANETNTTGENESSRNLTEENESSRNMTEENESSLNEDKVENEEKDSSGVVERKRRSIRIPKKLMDFNESMVDDANEEDEPTKKSRVSSAANRDSGKWNGDEPRMTPKCLMDDCDKYPKSAQSYASHLYQIHNYSLIK